MTSVAAPFEPESRPRAISALSHGSRRSRRSSISAGAKLDLTESHGEKEKRRLHSKADPTLAINEAQPAAVALEETTLDDLRQAQHKDFQGNIITDPDRSNPTRPRLERPLDTVRSFQMAAESTYSSRRSTYSGSRAASQINMNGASGRRNSYFGMNGNSPQHRNRLGVRSSYYQASGLEGRPDSYIDEYPSPNQPYGSRGKMRNVSNPMLNGPVGDISASHGHQSSYDTMTSGSDEKNSASTNPSSHNSSVDHFYQHRKLDEYGNTMSGLNPTYSPVSPTYPQYGVSHNSSPIGQSYHSNLNGSSQRPPNVQANEDRRLVPISLNSGTQNVQLTDLVVKSPAKRQGWFKRRFSKS